MRAGDKDTARQLMRDLATVEPISRLAIFDLDGKVWFDTGRGQPVVSSLDRAQIRALVASGREHLGIARSEAGEVYEALSPIRGQRACQGCHPRGDNLGAVAVILSSGPTRARLAEDRRSLAWTNLGVGLTSLIVLGLALAVPLVKRLRRLSAAARRVADGGSGPRRAARAGDEIAELAAAFDTMAERLEDTSSDLDRAKQELKDTLARVGQVAASAHDLGGLTSVLAEEAVRVGRADGAAFLLFDEEGDLRIRGSSGVPAEDLAAYEREPLSRSDALHAEEVSRAECEEDYHGAQRPACQRFAILQGAAGHFTVPLVHAGRLLGFLSLATRGPRRLDGDASRQLTALADQAAAAIEQVRLDERARWQAVTDGLTGLSNHRHFYERLAEELERARRFGHPLALIMLDVDHFKELNDRFGHQAGDTVLAGLAGTLRALVRKEDTVARYGGEEFAVLLLESDLEAAVAFAERLRCAVEEARLGGALAPGVAVTLSAGVASFPDRAREVESLILAADRALYAAKAAGRNRVRAAGEQLDDVLPREVRRAPC